MVADVPTSWDSMSYTSIGAHLLTHHLRRLCPGALSSPPALPPPHPQSCKDVTVFPGPLFFPFINGTDMKMIFYSEELQGQEFMASSRGYELHLYNHITGSVKVSLAGQSVLREVAARNCPAVVKLLMQRGAYML